MVALVFTIQFIHIVYFVYEEYASTM